jgi:hypothetical protein
MLCNYQDTATFYKTSPNGYNKRIVEEAVNIPVTFLQSTAFLHSNFQDAVEADAVLYVDPEDGFVLENYNRLEGMYVVCTPFGAPRSESWYKVETVEVNRDHLLSNQIDNIRLLLKKTERLEGVS